MHSIKYCAAGLLALVPAMAAADDDLATALTSGDAALDLRYRYEFVEQQLNAYDANASTLRLRLNYRTGTWHDWSGFAEFDQIIEVIADRFNSGEGTSSPARNRYPVVADPKGSDLNQLYLQYARGDEWRSRIGRQRILLDDQRFVGGVGWRQNEQTYDGMSFLYTGLSSAEIFYSYVSNVNRIFGSGVPAGDHKHDTHLLNVNVSMTDAWDVVGYAYLIDDEEAAAASTSTFGIRVSGAITSGDNRFDLLGEVATQSDYADNPATFDAGYYRVQATWSLDRFSVGAGLESMGSDNGQGFRTPLATLHAFDGWADQFLSTPGSGIDDLSLNAGFRPGPWNLQLIWHDFTAANGGTDFGTEIDFAAARKFSGRYGVLIKLADFNADDDNYQDTTKIWLMLTAGF